MRALEALTFSVLTFAPPVALAALGGVVSERAGLVNLGLEGMMRFGAFFGAWAALSSGSALTGLAAGAAAGLGAGLVLGSLSIWALADQMVAGIALNLLALGTCTFLLERGMGVFGGVTDPLPALPALGVAAGGHFAPLAVLLMVAPPLVLSAVYRLTPLGLRLRAVGELPQAVASAGLSVSGLRFFAALGSGALAGLGGALLPLAVLGRYEDRMPAGQGFVALAAVILGKWTPGGAFAAALFFAAAEGLRLTLSEAFPAFAASIPSGLLLALPYALTLALLAGFLGKASPPAADGVPYDPERR